MDISKEGEEGRGEAKKAAKETEYTRAVYIIALKSGGKVV